MFALCENLTIYADKNTTRRPGRGKNGRFAAAAPCRRFETLHPMRRTTELKCEPEKGGRPMAANRVKLTICGANYVIVSEDEESYVQELGTRLDEEMNELMTKNQAISVTGAAVLKALDYLDELRKATMSADNMRGQVRDYLEDAAKARLATQEAQQEIARLRRQIEQMKGQQH